MPRGVADAPMKFLVPAWGVVVLVLLASASILLATASAVFTVQAKLETMRARAMVARADSLVKDWVSRGCAPRTQALPD